MSEKPFLQLGTGTEKGILGSRRMGRKQENQNSFPAVWGGNGKNPTVIPVVWDGNGKSLILIQRFGKSTENLINIILFYFFKYSFELNMLLCVMKKKKCIVIPSK